MSLPKVMAPTKIGSAMGRRRDPAYGVLIGQIGPIVSWRLSCFWCEMPILSWRGSRRDCGMLHHADGVHGNNTPGNIIPMHNECHVAYHHSVEPEKYATLTRDQRVANAKKFWDSQAGEAARARYSAQSQQRWLDPEYKARVSARISEGRLTRNTHEQRVAATHKAWETRRARKAASPPGSGSAATLPINART